MDEAGTKLRRSMDEASAELRKVSFAQLNFPHVQAADRAVLPITVSGGVV